MSRVRLFLLLQVALKNLWIQALRRLEHFQLTMKPWCSKSIQTEHISRKYLRRVVEALLVLHLELVRV